MKFSLITPEHSPNNAQFLYELYESILAQTYENWEWIIYLNNACLPEHIHVDIKNHPKVRVVRTDIQNSNVGAVKKEAFSLGSGDVLVELDHDDIITPDCLQELYDAYQDTTIGFVYSDDAMLHMNDKFEPYSTEFGWKYKTFNWKGKDLISMESFEPSAQSIGYIWYAPDHVRSWRTDVYHAIGGHDPALSICDDHELMIRTYLNTKMHHIPKVLYIYRITGDNTWLARNDAIQQTTRNLFCDNIRKLAEKDAKDKGLLCIDIGGGLNPYTGFKTVDIRENADYVYDLNNGIPLPDNSVGVLNASHILEHLYDKHKIMSEIHRVLAHGGYAFIDVPSTDGRGAFQDPTHVSYWNENSFLYYTDKMLADFIDNDKIKFQEYWKNTYYPNEWLKNLNVLVTSVTLCAVKNTIRYPGALKI